jgi:hypothetical protein
MDVHPTKNGINRYWPIAMSKNRGPDPESVYNFWSIDIYGSWFDWKYQAEHPENVDFNWRVRSHRFFLPQWTFYRPRNEHGDTYKIIDSKWFTQHACRPSKTQNVDQQTLENDNSSLKTYVHTQVESWKLFHMSCFMTDLVFALSNSQRAGDLLWDSHQVAAKVDGLLE